MLTDMYGLKRERQIRITIHAVDEAFFVQPFREQHIFMPAAKKPPHVTIYSPFFEMVIWDEQVIQGLKDLFASFTQSEFTLKSTERFSDIGVLYMQWNHLPPLKPKVKPYGRNIQSSNRLYQTQSCM